MKTTTDQLRNGWNLAWYHHFTHISCAKRLRGLRKKLDALRVQTGPSLSKYKGFGRKLKCYKDISFFLFVSTPIFLCVQYEAIKATSSNFKHFWLHLLVFMYLVIYFELNNPKIENHYRSIQKWLKLGMVSSFHRHIMC